MVSLCNNVVPAPLAIPRSLEPSKIESSVLGGENKPRTCRKSLQLNSRDVHRLLLLNPINRCTPDEMHMQKSGRFSPPVLLGNHGTIIVREKKGGGGLK